MFYSGMRSSSITCRLLFLLNHLSSLAHFYFLAHFSSLLTFPGVVELSLFIYFFICWNSRLSVVLSYHFIGPGPSKGGMSASGICHLW